MPIPPLSDISDWFDSLNNDQLLAVEQYAKALREENVAEEVKNAARQAFIDASTP